MRIYSNVSVACAGVLLLSGWVCVWVAGMAKQREEAKVAAAKREAEKQAAAEEEAAGGSDDGPEYE